MGILGLDIGDAADEYGLTELEMNNAEAINEGAIKEDEEEEDEEEGKRRKKLNKNAILQKFVGKRPLK